jgi:glutathione S-transferase
VKLYGFWRSLASYRVRVALTLKGLKAEEISIDLLKGKQNSDDYLAVNPQGVVPALVIDDGGPPLFQSLAIMEYLEDIKPEPSLLPRDARGRARVRGLALIAAADGHPLITPRIRSYLEKEMARPLDDARARGDRRPSREGEGNRQVLPRQHPDPGRHLSRLAGDRRAGVFQLRHQGGAHRDAHLHPVHGDRRFRQGPSPEAARSKAALGQMIR